MVEDVGNQAYRGGVWIYNIKSRSLVRVARADANVFQPGAPGFVTKDEEASGIILHSRSSRRAATAGDLVAEAYHRRDG